MIEWPWLMFAFAGGMLTAAFLIGYQLAKEKRDA